LALSKTLRDFRERCELARAFGRRRALRRLSFTAQKNVIQGRAKSGAGITDPGSSRDNIVAGIGDAGIQIG